MCVTCGCGRGSAPPSAVEGVKAASRHLRGSVADELAVDTGTFTGDAAQVLKFHGVYQQDDRDARRAARESGGGKHHMLMVRTRTPGGRMDTRSYLALDDLASRYGDGTLRITTRQDFQFHGVLKRDARAVIRGINQTLLTTLGGCGDQVRNTMLCPAPLHDPLRVALRQVLGVLVTAMTPATRAYHEIWLDGERVDAADESEPLYGETYLPRKFKIAVAVEDDNCVDALANDLALVATRGPEGGLHGFHLLVGGGLGRTHNKPDTFPALARPLGWVAAGDVVEAARGVVRAQRDLGNRSDRRHARLKYLIAANGVEWFADRVRERCTVPIHDPRPIPKAPVHDHLGWHEQGDGRLWLGVRVENGRIADAGKARLRTALRTVVERFGCGVRLTAQQNLLLADVDPADRGAVDEVLAGHGVVPVHRLPLAVRHAMACPALPTCGLATAEAERVMPDLTRRLAALLADLDLHEEPIGWRMTGCPNGCARPYMGDVGFVGTTLGKYDVHLGGDAEGTRLSPLYARNVPLGDICAVLRAPLAAFAAERAPGEAFGDWCHRVSVDTLRGRFLEAGPAPVIGPPPAPVATTRVAAAR